MALIIRRRCQRCGASSESGSAETGWVRCPACRAILDFDWLSFFESPAYAAYLAHAADAAREGWPRYQSLIASADVAVANGDLANATQQFRLAVEALVDLTPFMYPPEVRSDSRYRDETLAVQAWWLLQCRIDPTVRGLQQQLEATLRAVDYRDPLPTLRQVATIQRSQAARLGASDAPPDPDGMQPIQRARVWVGVTLGAWVRMLAPEGRVELLRELHGAANVIVAGTSQADELGLFAEMACPACGLASLQARSSPEWVCLGCFARRPAPTGPTLEAVQIRCPGCGGAVDLPSAAMVASCTYCGAEVRRLVETGAVMREYVETVQRAATGVALPREPSSPGLATASNRRQLAAAGFVRLVDAYASMVPPARLLKLLERTAEALQMSAAELRSEAERVANEQGGAGARKLLSSARKSGSDETGASD